MPKFIKVPFATSGDKTAIPDATDPSGFVSWTQGYPADYSRNRATDPLAKVVERRSMNQALFDISAGLNQYQTHGFPDFITTADNGGAPYSYDKGAMCVYSDGFVYESLVNSNTSLPTDATKWAKFVTNTRAQRTYSSDDWAWLDKANNLIVQWGTASLLASNGASGTLITFSTPFIVNGCLGIVCVDSGAGCYADGVAPISGSGTQFKAWSKLDNGTYVDSVIRWFAIGIKA